MAKKLPKHVREYFRKQGAKGGKKAAAGMTATQKSERARKAAREMHAKRRRAKGK